MRTLPTTFSDPGAYCLPGQIKRMLDCIIEQRSKGNRTIATTTRTKLVLKGVNPDQFTANSADDTAIIAKVQAIAVEFGLTVR